ncbi:MAG: efflux RND transporter periplasmic adaptor subunit [Burkholderiaceae bacterium]|nr:efflux RND transporter periplasmic adaptor subunit [Burkholderiaceae bacterium]
MGTVTAQRSYLIGPTASARVKRILVDVGDDVKAGQLLAEMDPVDLDAKLTSAEAATARAKSAVQTAQAQVLDAKSKQQLAASETHRYVDLGNKGFVSKNVVEGKVQQQQSADAQYSAAVSSLAAAKQDLTRVDAERDAAKQQRANINLIAPSDGVVTARDAEPGSTVVAGQSVLKMMKPESMWITTRLDQSRSIGLQLGLGAQITLRSSPKQQLAGKVARIEPISDSVTEERIAQVSFDTIPSGVTTGEMAEVTLKLPVVEDVLLIPNASVRRRGNKVGVWLRKDGRMQFTPVKTGVEGLDGMVQVFEGLSEGDEIVVHSEQSLNEDSRIKVVSSLGGKKK